MNFLSLIKPKSQRNQDMKERILKNKEAVLDVMAANIKGARACPYLLGQKCLGQLCEFFLEFKTIDNITKKEYPYWRCVHIQNSMLLIELIQTIARQNKEVK